MLAELRFRPDAIRELMARENLNISGFAARIRVSRQRVSVWLEGECSPQFPVVLLMCRAFGCDPGFFAEGLGKDARQVAIGTETGVVKRTA